MGSFLPGYVTSLPHFPTRACHVGALASRHVYTIFLLKVENTQEHFTKRLFLRLTTCFGPCPGSGATAQQAYVRRRLWPVHTIPRPAEAHLYLLPLSSLLEGYQLPNESDNSDILVVIRRLQLELLWRQTALYWPDLCVAILCMTLDRWSWTPVQSAQRKQLWLCGQDVLEAQLFCLFPCSSTYSPLPLKDECALR